MLVSWLRNILENPTESFLTAIVFITIAYAAIEFVKDYRQISQWEEEDDDPVR